MGRTYLGGFTFEEIKRSKVKSRGLGQSPNSPYLYRLSSKKTGKEMKGEYYNENSRFIKWTGKR